MGILWTILIGFIAGVLAKLITPGDNEPSGFILTTILGIVGAFVASFLGQALGWYNAGEGAGLIGATVGAIIVLLVWGAIAGRREEHPSLKRLPGSMRRLAPPNPQNDASGTQRVRCLVHFTLPGALPAAFSIAGGLFASPPCPTCSFTDPCCLFARW